MEHQRRRSCRSVVFEAERGEFEGSALSFIVGSRQIAGSPEPLRLGQVTLKELPDWLAGRAPRQPRDLLDMLQKGKYFSSHANCKKINMTGQFLKNLFKKNPNETHLFLFVKNKQSCHVI